MRLARPARRSRLPAAAAVLIMLAAQLTGTALGHHGGREIGSVLACDRPVTPPRCSSVGNNIWHRIHFDVTLTPDLASSLRDTMAEDYDVTSLVMIEEPARTAATDAIAFSGDYGDNGAAAWVYCPREAPQGINRNDHRWCQQQEIYFNLNARYAAFFADDASRDHVTCHELGHTLGVRHWGNPPQSEGPPAATCMNANTPDGPPDLHQFDRDHIDAYYKPPVNGRKRPMLADAGHQHAGNPLGAASGVLDATGLEWHASLSDLVGSADAVVYAHVTSVTPGRVFGPDGSEFHYASVALGVREVLAGVVTGASGNEQAILEVPLFDGRASLSAVEAAVSGFEGIFFLRAKADDGFYRLVTPEALVAADDSGLAAIPDAEAAYLSALHGRAFSAVIAEVRAAAP